MTEDHSGDLSQSVRGGICQELQAAPNVFWMMYEDNGKRASDWMWYEICCNMMFEEVYLKNIAIGMLKFMCIVHDKTVYFFMKVNLTQTDHLSSYNLIFTGKATT